MRKKALQMAGIGILLFGMVCSGCDRKAQVNAEPESSEKIEYAVTETEEVSTETKKLVIEDLDDAYEALLDSCSKEFIGDYRIDESFLNWVYANYGKEAVSLALPGTAKKLLVSNAGRRKLADADHITLESLETAVVLLKA